MPFKSQAQRRLFYHKEQTGELPKGTAERWAKHTPDIKHLPEHVKHHAKKAYEEGVKAAVNSLTKSAMPENLQIALQMLAPAALGTGLGAGIGALTADDAGRGATLGALTGGGIGLGLTGGALGGGALGSLIDRQIGSGTVLGGRLGGAIGGTFGGIGGHALARRLTEKGAAEFSGDSCVDHPQPKPGLSLPKTTKEPPPLRYHKSSLENSWEHKKQAAYEEGVRAALCDAGLAKQADFGHEDFTDEELMNLVNASSSRPIGYAGAGLAGAVGGGLAGYGISSLLGRHRGLLGPAIGAGLGGILGTTLLGPSWGESAHQGYEEVREQMKEEARRRGLI